MFGIGISELLVIFLVALLVLGPEQLPKVARTLAKVLGEFRRHSEDLRLNLMGASNDVRIEQKNFNQSLQTIPRGEVLEMSSPNPRTEVEDKQAITESERHG